MGLQLDTAFSAFEEGTDFTVGLEEEFALVDPVDLGLVQRFEELSEAAASDPVLSDAITGELISSEIEIRSGRGENLAASIDAQRERRRRLFALAAERGVLLAATGTHPWADYRQQHIIETDHYQRVEEGLKYVAWRNNTFSLHLHVGIRGADRAVKVCDRLRTVAPLLLAISANSPFLDGRNSGLHSARSQIFTKSFPRCGIPDEYGSWSAFADYIDMLITTNSIIEYTQVWWSLRPHFTFGTVEVRICDAQSTAAESEGLASLMVACVAQAAREIDAGVPVQVRAAPRDRRELLAGDQIWLGRSHDRPGQPRGVPRRRGNGAPARLERPRAGRARHRRRATGAQRRPAPEAHVGDRRVASGGLWRNRRGDARDVCWCPRKPRGGEKVSTTGGSEQAGAQPTEEELRAAYEAEIKKIRVEHVLLEQVVTLVNLGMRRTGLQPGTEDERDVEQVGVAIDGIRALLPLLERAAPDQIGPIRDALSQLQLAFVRIGGSQPSGAPGGEPSGATGGEPSGEPGAGRPPEPSEPSAPGTPGSQEPKPGEPGPAQRSGRLWVPGQS